MYRQFSDIDIRTQHGIAEFARWAAKMLAEASRASAKVTGDPVALACVRWRDIIYAEAIKLLIEEAPSPMIEDKYHGPGESD